MKPNPYRRSWITKAKIERWRENAERYAQEHYDLSHRGNFEILRIGAFTDMWLKMDWSKITTNNRPLNRPWYANAKYLLWAQSFPHLCSKKERPTKEHYLFVDEHFNIVQECGVNGVTFKINNATIKKMVRKGVIKPQTSTDIIEAKILLVSGE